MYGATGAAGGRNNEVRPAGTEPEVPNSLGNLNPTVRDGFMTELGSKTADQRKDEPVRDSDLLLQLLELPERHQQKVLPSEEVKSARTGTEVYYAVHNRPMESMHKKASNHRFESMNSLSKLNDDRDKAPLFTIGAKQKSAMQSGEMTRTNSRGGKVDRAIKIITLEVPFKEQEKEQAAS